MPVPRSAPSEPAPSRPRQPRPYESASDYSSTNVQVKGIDEPHIIKTDGKHIYTVSRRTLFIVDTSRGQGTVVAAKVLPGKASGLFVHANRVTAVGTFSEGSNSRPNGPIDELTYISVYDIGDRNKPELVADHVVEGHFVDGRLQGGFAYFAMISKAYPRGRPSPLVTRKGTLTHVPIGRTIAFRQPRQSPSFATVHAVDLSSPASISSKAVLVGSLTAIYMSAGNLYLADTGSVTRDDLVVRLLPELTNRHLTSQDNSRISRLGAIDDDLMSRTEKDDRIMKVVCDRLESMKAGEADELLRRARVRVAEIVTRLGSHQATAIHRLSVSGRDISPQGTAVVVGKPLNQWSFDEYAGSLRVAATRAQDNAVYTLDHNLDVIGELGELGMSERIYAVRFMAERLYLVTFRETDPFYVIDTSNPRKPRLLGTLKIPGVSHYLHPWGPHEVLGIGNPRNAGRGLKISLFDVSQVSQPFESARYIEQELTPTISTAHGHRAIIIDREKQLLVLPVRSQRKPGVGALVLRATSASLQRRGEIWHEVADWAELSTQSIDGTLYIGDRLFTKSTDVLRASQLSTLRASSVVFLW